MSVARVLVVDDSAMVRRLVGRQLDEDPEIQVVGTAADAREALHSIFTLQPDVLTLDVEMPGMSGVDFLRELRKRQDVPVILYSAFAGSRHSAAVMDAMREGNVQVVAKPQTADGFEASLGELKRAIKRAAFTRAFQRASLPPRDPPSPTPPQQAPQVASRAPVLRTAGAGDPVIVVGSSTGGPQALMTFVSHLPDDAPGVVIAQHLMAGFSEALATRLGQVGRRPCAEARPGVMVTPGTIWLAPSTQHVRLLPAHEGYRLQIDEGPEVNGHRPSVDVLFESAARVSGAHTIGVLLTGMGRDGAEGLLKIRRAGGHTFAQDEASCVVYGMPKAAAELGAAVEVLPIPDIARRAGEVARRQLALGR